MNPHETLLLLLKDALENGANDIFLMEDEPPRARIEGSVTTLHEGPIPAIVMSDFWRTCGVEPGERTEADISWVIPGGKRLRVNLYRSLGRLAAVARPINRNVPTMERLGLPAPLLQSWMQRRYGLVLVTGPTGSGKSTSVASCLEWVNRYLSRHVVTLEDPIEFIFENDHSYFSQREIRNDAPDFATGLRAALRQSPDILFLGEIRDTETALAALQAAETGHLVISTLHCSSVVETLDRLGNLIRSSTGALNLLSSQLIGVLSQQLLPRVDGGLFAALEYFQNEAATRRWILDHKLTELQDHIQKVNTPTQCSMIDYLVASTQQGFIDAETARAACARPQDFDRAMRGITH
jgi:pilus retraction protein PilT